MLTEDMKHICFQELIPKDIWNLAILYAIQTVEDVCDSDYKLLSSDFRLLESELRKLLFTHEDA